MTDEQSPQAIEPVPAELPDSAAVEAADVFNRKLCDIARGVGGCSIVVSLIIIWNDFYVIGHTFPRPGDLNIRQLYDYLEVARLSFWLVKIAFLIVFLRWIYRTAQALQLKTGGRLRFTPGWCVQAFLLPIANLWESYRVLRELQRCRQFLPRDKAQAIHDAVAETWLAVWLLECGAICAYLAARVYGAQESMFVVMPNSPMQTDLKRALHGFLYTDIALLSIDILFVATTYIFMRYFDRLRPIMWRQAELPRAE